MSWTRSSRLCWSPERLSKEDLRPVGVSALRSSGAEASDAASLTGPWNASSRSASLCSRWVSFTSSSFEGLAAAAAAAAAASLPLSESRRFSCLESARASRCRSWRCAFSDRASFAVRSSMRAVINASCEACISSVFLASRLSARQRSSRSSKASCDLFSSRRSIHASSAARANFPSTSRVAEFRRARVVASTRRLFSEIRLSSSPQMFRRLSPPVAPSSAVFRSCSFNRLNFSMLEVRNVSRFSRERVSTSSFGKPLRRKLATPCGALLSCPSSRSRALSWSSSSEHRDSNFFVRSSRNDDDRREVRATGGLRAEAGVASVRVMLVEVVASVFDGVAERLVSRGGFESTTSMPTVGSQLLERSL
uniref:Uncharacterized protein n=1 Tax=Rhipicephalus appendiculatus TaxID=34631 RepID=A0A131YBN8_RHIAP